MSIHERDDPRKRPFGDDGVVIEHQHIPAVGCVQHDVVCGAIPERPGAPDQLHLGKVALDQAIGADVRRRVINHGHRETESRLILRINRAQTPLEQGVVAKIADRDVQIIH
jgi:hypothetical protein